MSKLSKAAKFEMVCSLIEGMPIMCDCKPDCDVIVARGEPLITKQQAIELLGISEEFYDSVRNAPLKPEDEQ